jgi:hypothetical protein
VQLCPDYQLSNCKVWRTWRPLRRLCPVRLQLAQDAFVTASFLCFCSSLPSSLQVRLSHKLKHCSTSQPYWIYALSVPMVESHRGTWLNDTSSASTTIQEKLDVRSGSPRCCRVRSWGYVQRSTMRQSSIKLTSFPQSFQPTMMEPDSSNESKTSVPPGRHWRKRRQGHSKGVLS